MASRKPGKRSGSQIRTLSMIAERWKLARVVAPESGDLTRSKVRAVFPEFYFFSVDQFWFSPGLSFLDHFPLDRMVWEPWKTRFRRGYTPANTRPRQPYHSLTLTIKIFCEWHVQSSHLRTRTSIIFGTALRSIIGYIATRLNVHDFDPWLICWYRPSDFGCFPSIISRYA